VYTTVNDRFVVWLRYQALIEFVDMDPDAMGAPSLLAGALQFDEVAAYLDDTAEPARGLIIGIDNPVPLSDSR